MIVTEEDEESIKKARFDGLYALDHEDDDTEDEGLSASFHKIKGKTLGDPTHPYIRRRVYKDAAKDPAPVARSFSAISTLTSSSVADSPKPNHRRTKNPLQTLDEFVEANSTVIKDTPKLQHRHTIIGTELANDLPISATMPTSSAPLSSSAIPKVGTRKRKRDADIKLVPEDQRIFQNLHFCKWFAYL